MSCMPTWRTVRSPPTRAHVNLCYTAPIGVADPSHTVNGTAVTDPIADAEVSITSHEQFETVNDAEVGTAQQYAPPLAWYDIVNGEIGDKCAYKYGNYAADGSNIVLHGNHYIVQTEYSNWDNGCALTAYQGNGGYGGASPSVTIQKGWNLISVPVSGITDTAQLVSSLTSAGMPAGSITEVQTYHNGKYQTYFPGKGKAAATRSHRRCAGTEQCGRNVEPEGNRVHFGPHDSAQSGMESGSRYLSQSRPDHRRDLQPDRG